MQTTLLLFAVKPFVLLVMNWEWAAAAAAAAATARALESECGDELFDVLPDEEEALADDDDEEDDDDWWWRASFRFRLLIELLDRPAVDIRRPLTMSCFIFLNAPS